MTLLIFVLLMSRALADVPEVIFNVCLRNCGTDVQGSENRRFSVKNSIFYQHGSVDEFEKTIDSIFLGPLDYSSLVQIEYFTLEDVTGLNDFFEYQSNDQKLAVDPNLSFLPFLDVDVENRNPHEGIILKENPLCFKVISLSGNPGIPTDIVSALNVKTVKILNDYDQTRTMSFESKLNEQHVTCEIKVCMKKCVVKSSERKRQKEKLMSIHNIKKRSIVTTTSLPLQKSFEIRGEFLKSTVKALAQTLKRRRQNLKRGHVSKIVGQTVAPPTDIPDSINEELGKNPSVNAKSSAIKNSGFTDLLPEHKTEPKYFHTDETFAYELELSTTKIPQATDFTEYVESSSKSEVNRLTTEEFSKRKGRVEDFIHQDQSVEDEGNSQDLNIKLTEAKNFNIIESNEAENLLTPQHKDCVPKLQFTVMAIILGFILLTFFFMCCGMFLYLRKQKKKRLIDAFLLYNFRRGNRSDSF